MLFDHAHCSSRVTWQEHGTDQPARCTSTMTPYQKQGPALIQGALERAPRPKHDVLFDYSQQTTLGRNWSGCRAMTIFIFCSRIHGLREFQACFRYKVPSVYLVLKLLRRHFPSKFLRKVFLDFHSWGWAGSRLEVGARSQRIPTSAGPYPNIDTFVLIP